MIIGLITRIDPIKESKNKGDAYVRVHFDIKNNKGETRWAKTDLVPTFKNYKRWEPFLKVGNILGNLSLKDNLTVNADSLCVLLEKEPTLI